MAFPQDPLGIKGEMQINGVWTDVSSRIREDADVRITNGRSSEQGGMTPSTCSFTINNRDGLYSNDNPLSAYYGLLPNNTPFRVSVTEAGTFASLPNYLNSYYPSVNYQWNAGAITTTDKAVLDVVGDLDLRIEIEPEHWQLGDIGPHLAGKYATTSNQRSWAWFILPSGRMRLYWSPDGTSPITPGFYADSTAEVPQGARIALRVTIDVNNGASGRTITFYTSSSILGTWTQLGAAVVQPTVTSIFNSTAPLHVGAIRDPGTLNYSFYSQTDAPKQVPLVGRIYRFQMYSGIAGTLVADANPAGQTAGTTTWSDGLGTPNTWTLANSATITASNFRAYGEISEMPQEWDSTGRDIYVPMQADGILRRLTQGVSPLRSPVYRNLSQLVGTQFLQYIPGEDGSRATSAASASPGQSAAFTRAISFGEDDLFPASAGVMAMNDDNGLIRVPVTNTVNADQAFLIFYYKYPTAPLADIEVMNLYTTGTIARTSFTVGAATYRVSAYDRTGALINSSFTSFGAGAAPGQWIALQIRLTKNGTGTDIDLGWYPINGTVFYGVATLNIPSSTIGRPTSASTTSGAALGRVSFAHIAIGNSTFNFTDYFFYRSSNGFTGENALARFLRILAEEGLTGLAVGWVQDTELMGPQPIATLPDILEECADTDGGMIYQARDQGAFVMRSRRSLYGQYATQLNYAAKHLTGTFRPTNDDRYTRNEVTAQQSSGSSAIATKESGPKSILPPPNGVGKYDSQIDVNSATDARLPYLAQQAVYLGTWPEQRVPSFEVMLQRSVFVADPTLSAAVKSINPGDRVTVSNTPIWVGGGTADMLIQGYDEVLKNRGWEFAFSTSQYGPWLAYNNLTSATNTRNRLAAVNSTLNTAVNSSALAFSVVTPATNTRWGTTTSKPGNFPLDIMVAGERATVSGIANDVTDDFSRTVANSWGNATSGQAWTASGGTAANFNVGSNVGTISLTSLNVGRRIILPTTYVNSTQIINFKISVNPVGDDVETTLMARYQDTTNYMQASIFWDGDATFADAQIVRRLAGVTLSLGTITLPFTQASSSLTAWLLFDVEGSTYRMKAWAGARSAEPPAWMITGTDTTWSSGLNGVRANIQPSNTNTLPVTVTADDYAVLSPQAFTLSARAVNGISKSQAAGAAVQVADIFYAAL